MPTIKERAEQYIKSETDKTFIDEVKNLIANKKHRQIRDAFGTELAFGTGGMRGIIGGGSNRMNPYVIGRTAQGIARYLLEISREGNNPPLKTVIAYDSRHYSLEFSKTCAEVLAAHGIKSSLFSVPCPTPLLSFAVRKLNADAGIMITASHNPPEYNGCKVYWRGGAQLTAPHDQNIIDHINASKEVKRMPIQQAKEAGLVTELRNEIDDQYCDYILTLGLNRELTAAEASTLSVTYTPLHGVGATLFRRLSDALQYRYYMVAEQAEPNGDFPTVKSPNPENKEALAMVLKQGKKNGSDIVLANDPDADRVAVAVWHKDTYHILSGNQTGALMIDYVLQRHTELGTLPKNAAVIKTIVTTELQRKISESYGVVCYDTLTGFKHIAAKIHEFEQMKDGPQFVIGGEESIGYMRGSEVRDKDGIGAALLLMEMALHQKRLGKTIIDRLHQLYIEHGYFEEETVSKVIRGLAGVARITAIMDTLRKNPPQMIGDISVQTILDYKQQKITNCATQMTQSIRGFPVSDVLQFRLADESTISIRPSGTEPKIKFYASSRFTPHVEIEQAQRITHGMIEEMLILIEEWTEIKIEK